jgi:hypothetical protein
MASPRGDPSRKMGEFSNVIRAVDEFIKGMGIPFVGVGPDKARSQARAVSPISSALATVDMANRNTSSSQVYSSPPPGEREG